MSRWKAAGIHLVLSILLIGSVLTLTFAVWYPAPLGNLQGVLKPAFTLALVDVVVGPFLTLLVFKSEKRGLKADLSIIGLIQITALLAGIWTIEQGRPIVVASSVDRFRLVTQTDLVEADFSPSNYPASLIEGPRFVYAATWQDPMASFEVITGTRAEHHVVASNYRPIPEGLDKLRPIDPERIAALPAAKVAYEELLQDLGADSADVLLFPLNGRAGDGSIVISATDGSVVKMASVDIEGLLAEAKAKAKAKAKAETGDN